MLTYRLADSLPLTLANELLARGHNDPQARRRLERLLDQGIGTCLLHDPHIAGVVEENLLHFDGERYCLIAWVVMPNHVHTVIEMSRNWPLSTVVQGWKSYTAKAANKILGRNGPFWQPEYYDRAVRDARHLAAAVAYVESNPVKADLVQWPEDWRFSSAAAARPTAGAGGPPALPGSGRGRLGPEDYS